MKVLVKHIFSIVNESKPQRCGCTKEDALQLKKYWGYMIKKSRGKVIEELSEASKVSIEHMFNSRVNYSAEWCFKTGRHINSYGYNYDYVRMFDSIGIIRPRKGGCRGLYPRTQR